jgi:4-oxalocrotonate tautomerase
MVEIEGENLRPVTWVLVEEVRSGDWGIAGNGLTTADVHALQGQPAAANSAFPQVRESTGGGT